MIAYVNKGSFRGVRVRGHPRRATTTEPSETPPRRAPDAEHPESRRNAPAVHKTFLYLSQKRQPSQLNITPPSSSSSSRSGPSEQHKRNVSHRNVRLRRATRGEKTASRPNVTRINTRGNIALTCRETSPCMRRIRS